MIDWVNCVLPYKHSERINGGACIHIDHNGETQSTTMKKMMVRGSYDAGCAIQTSSEHPLIYSETGEAYHSHIWVSGSPKFLQGHNLFGVDSPLTLACLLAESALNKLGLNLDPFTRNNWLSGRGLKFTRIDITYMLDVGTETDAASWIEAASNQLSAKYRGRGESRDGTIYYGKHSRRWALKLYRKFQEINSRSKNHALPEGIEHRDELRNYARGTIRSELVLHSMQLKKIGLQKGESWANASSPEIWGEYMKKLDMQGNLTLRESEIEKLKPSLRSTYALWRDGRCMSRLLSKATYYRHRALLIEHGIDISKPCTTKNNVVPLLRVIEARPKAVPSWALNSSIYAKSA